MTTVTLERIKVDRQRKASPELQQLARDAQLILKHNDLADRVIRTRPSLSEVLHGLDIEILSRDSVCRYQRQKRHDLEKAAQDQDPPSYASYYWGETNIADAENVPPFVLRKAIDIKRACPEVKLMVESISSDPDPFLVAKLGRETYYIEVWDEKDFEKEL